MTFASGKTRQRIVSLAPSVTSILVALGARKQLVAVSKWCKDVADVKGLPELGDCWSLGAKESAAEEAAAMMKLRPTLIIGSVPFKAETVQKILALPVPFLALNPRSLADVKADIRLLGQMINADGRANALIREMELKFDRVRRVAKRANRRPRVYCEAWPHPRISSPPWVAEVVNIVGGEMNVRAGECISDEDVAKADPEVIVLAWAATGGKSKPKQALENPAWKAISAVREGKVFVIRDELLNTPGPPLVCGAEELLRVIHPELATDRLQHRRKQAPRGNCKGRA
ncbi:MAG TPA: ABC transporter substrate-binding protein [Candidatus Acidoferrales bacterium]|nr:ABC transporter substrate-binding protein [Candidatus Acidoferrales bacterium]